jgi:hypothetical protein
MKTNKGISVKVDMFRCWKKYLATGRKTIPRNFYDDMPLIDYTAKSGGDTRVSPQGVYNKNRLISYFYQRLSLERTVNSALRGLGGSRDETRKDA